VPAREEITCDGALIVGGAYNALAIARSLGRRGIAVWIAGAWHQGAARSRYVRKCLPWPEEADAKQRVSFLIDAAHRYHLQNWVLLAGNDAAADLLARYRDTLAPVFRISTSPLGVVREALDKRRSYAQNGNPGRQSDSQAVESF
jgi:D-aspartate ligase